MPDSLIEAGRKEAEALAREQADTPGCQREVSVTVDTEKVEARAGLEGEHWSVAAYTRYYWDKTKAWCGGVVGKVTW